MEQSSIQAAARAAFICEPKALAKAAKAVCLVVERRNAIPILSNVRILCGSGKVFITGTDLDMEFTASIPAEADGRFHATVNAKHFADLAGKAKGNLTITAPLWTKYKRDDESLYWDTEEKLQLAAGPVKVGLPVLPVSDFPTFKPMEGAHSFDIAGRELRALLEGVAFAMSTEETRYYLNGVYLYAPQTSPTIASRQTALVAVATDGHRLGEMYAWAEGAKGMPGVIVPRKTVAVLLKLWKGKECPETVRVSVTETGIKFAWAGAWLASKVIDGTFPDYHRVIPQPSGNVFRAQAADLDSCIAAVDSIGESKAVKLSIGIACRISKNSPDCGVAASDLACGWSGEEGFEIGFNARYMRDVCAVASPDGGEITFEMADAGSPALVIGTRPNARYVMMPLRV
jgi:DNA polymerase III subunit beta